MKIRVGCPHCGSERNTESIFRIRCFNCNRTFEVYPLDSHGRCQKSRIIGIVEGTIEDLHKEAYKKLQKKIYFIL